MKVKDFFIVAIIFLGVLFLPLRIDQEAIRKSNNSINDCNRMLARATEDAAQQLVYTTDSYSNENVGEGERYNERDINLNLDKALDRFYKTMFLNMNIENSYAEQQALLHKIPIKIATGYEGYYINSFKNDGSGEQWSDIKPYSFVEDDKVIYFTLSDEVYVSDSINGIKRGMREDFEDVYENSCLNSKKEFHEVKSHVINRAIQQDLQYYTKQANNIAKRNNWNTQFNVPYWGNRSVNDIAFIAFYQDEGFIGSDRMYNTYGYATTKIVKNKDIYGYMKNGRKLYSEIKSGEGDTYFSNAYEAAINGYSPDILYYGK